MSKTISYYQDEKNNLWKKEDGDEFFFSRKELKWIKSKIVFILPDWDYRYTIEDSEAQMILDDYKKEGSLNTDEMPFRYFLNDNEMVFAEDILGNEFYVVENMSLKAAPKGTIDLYWSGIDKIEAKIYVVGELFQIKHGYSFLDEDHSYKIIVFSDGSIYVSQMESFCYDKQSTVIEKQKSDIIKKKVKELYNQYKKEIDDFITMNGERNPFSGSINGKYFFLNSLDDLPFIKKIAKAIKMIIEETYPNEIDWSISISNGYNAL